MFDNLFNQHVSYYLQVISKSMEFNFLYFKLNIVREFS